PLPVRSRSSSSRFCERDAPKRADAGSNCTCNGWGLIRGKKAAQGTGVELLTHILAMHYAASVVPLQCGRRARAECKHTNSRRTAMKRSMILLATVFAMGSTSLLAQNTATQKTDAANSKAVVLSDAELDNITAGSGLVATGILNPGNASIFRV